MRLFRWLFVKKIAAPAAPVAEAATATQVIEVADVEMAMPAAPAEPVAEAATATQVIEVADVEMPMPALPAAVKQLPTTNHEPPTPPRPTISEIIREPKPEKKHMPR